MSLGFNNMFGHSRAFEQGLGAVRKGTYGVVVANDKSGDFTSIQEAINSLKKTGGVVYIKQGTYIIDKQLEIKNDNISLIGVGLTSVIQGNGITTLLHIEAENIIIQGIRFDGDNVDSSQGIYVYQSNKSKILDCYFTNFKAIGIHTYLMSYNLEIIGNKFYDSDGYGIFASYGDTFIVSNNHLVGGTHEGIYILAQMSVITNNYVANYGRHGIRIENTNYNIITNNTIITNSYGSSNTYSGIYLTGSSSVRNIISANQINGGASQKYGIEENGGDKNIFISNVCINNVTGQILVTGANTINAHNIQT